MRLLTASQMLPTTGTGCTFNSTSQLAQLTHMVYKTPRRSAQDEWCMITATSTTSLSCMNRQHTISSAALHSQCSLTCADCISNSYVFKSQGQQTAVNQLVCHKLTTHSNSVKDCRTFRVKSVSAKRGSRTQPTCKSTDCCTAQAHARPIWSPPKHRT